MLVVFKRGGKMEDKGGKLELARANWPDWQSHRMHMVSHWLLALVFQSRFVRKWKEGGKWKKLTKCLTHATVVVVSVSSGRANGSHRVAF